MAIVRIENNVVKEIIPEYALPVEKYFPAEWFINQCREAPDGVLQGWIYDPKTGVYSAPTPNSDGDDGGGGLGLFGDDVYSTLWAAVKQGIDSAWNQEVS